MLEYYFNQFKANVKFFQGFLTICFKLFIVLCIFYSGVFYANSDKGCSLVITKGNETYVYEGVKSVL